MALVVLDANVLLYAFNRDDVAHQAARKWLEEKLSSDDIVGVPMPAISALLRASTHASLDRIPDRMKDAIRFLDELTAFPNVRVLHTDDQHWRELKKVLNESGVSGRMVTDAQFAALTRQNDGTLYTTDGGFRRFASLRCENPIAKAKK